MYRIHVGDKGSHRPGLRFQEAIEARKRAAELSSLQGAPESSLPKCMKVKPSLQWRPQGYWSCQDPKRSAKAAVVTGCSWLERIPYLLQAAGLESLEYGICSALFSISLV